MVQIVFFILKWIGWIFLGILGLILGILLLVLFGAVRYRVDGKKGDTLEGKIRVTWLFRIISLLIGYQDGLAAQVKLFGITLWKLKEKDGREEADSTEENAAEETDNPKEAGGKTKGADKAEEANKAKKAGKAKEIDKVQALQNEWEALNAEREKLLAQEKAEKGQEESKEKAKKSLWEKIKDTVTAWIEKLRFSFSEICGKLKQIEEKKVWLMEKWDWLSQIIHDPANQASFRLILRQVKKIVRHVLPQKGEASVVFGLEDPYLMGKLLSYAGAAYPFTHKFLTIHPVFGENRMEGEVHLRGRIRLGVILGYVLRLLFNKNIRRRLKEVLHGR